MQVRGSKRSRANLRLESEECQAEEYANSDEQGLNDDCSLVEGDNHTNRERFNECEK